ncbi:MAG: triose-phosphate isomerase [Rhizobiaceae bacterium]
MGAGMKSLVAGNWKMNGTSASLEELSAMISGVGGDGADMLVCVPFTLLGAASALAKDSRIMIGAQDCHARESGAHTGDISAPMIRDCGAGAVIVGHSERRTDHGETSAQVRAKAQAALDAGLLPVICIGETGAEREANRTLDVLRDQLAGSLPDNPQVVIAYEPVWAIGTGLTPTVEDVAAAHAFIRGQIVERFGNAGHAIRLLYGGSVKASNAASLLSVDNVNGALVGGASLKAADFLAIHAACPSA